MSEKTTLGENGIYDARSLGVPKMLLLGLQHMFAMFGATILVPMLTGLDVSTTLLFAGLGTLLFHLLTKRKVPAFLGSSFAFLGGYAAIAPMADGADNSALLPYACFGVACAGLVFLVLSLLFNHLWGIYGLYAACAVAPSISVPLGWLYTAAGRLLDFATGYVELALRALLS